MSGMKHLRHDLKKMITIDNIYTSLVSSYSNGHSSLGEEHDFHELVYVDKGVIYAEVGAETGYRTVRLPEGYAYLHAPNCWHRHFAAQNDEGSMCIVSFRCEDPALHILEEKCLALTKRQQNYLSEVMHFATRMFRRFVGTEDSFIFEKRHVYNPAIEQMLQNHLEILVLDLYMQQEEEMQETIDITSSKDKQLVVERLKLYLKERVYDRIAIEDICRQFSYSKATLSSWFKQYTGWSMISYFNRLKVEEAIRLMEEGSLTITSIAAELNFSSAPYFSRVFKEHVGMYPRDFKKSTLNKAELEQLQILSLENGRERTQLFQGNEY